MYDNLIKEASDQMTTTNNKIGEEVSALNESVVLLDSLKANSDATLSTQENIACKTEVIKSIADYIQRTMTGSRSYTYLEYIPTDDLDTTCGQLVQKETHIDLGEIV